MMFLGKLRASLSPLFCGKNGIMPATSKVVFLNRINGQVQISNRSQFTSPFSGGRRGSFRSRGIRLLYHPLHSSVQDDFAELDEPKQEDTEGVDNPEQKFSYVEDGEWSELGSVKKGKIVIPKLMTEKPEPLKKANGKRKVSADATLLAKNILNLKDLSSKPSISSPTTGHKPKTHDNGSSSITVSNVPSSVQCSQLRLAMSTFGKISKVSSRRKQDGSDIYEIDFQDVESRKRALAAGHVGIKNAKLELQPGEIRHVVVRIRISNLNSETADSVVHSKCVSFGPLEGLARVDEDIVDALFRVRDSLDAESIQDKLNNTIVDDFQWSAKLQSRIPTLAALVSEPEASQDQIGLHIRSCRDDLLTQISMLKIHVEDLEILLQSIWHLENHPIANRD